jgi:aminotransferase
VEISRRVRSFTESVIREMTRVVDQVGGVNLAQGMPNFPPPRELIAAAHRAIDGDFHQYAVTWGAPSLRQAIAGKYRAFYGMDVDADRHVTVCCGSTETMLSTLLAVLNPGDEVIIFEPFYENYGPGCIISGAVPVFVPLEPPEYSFDPDRLRRAVTPRTRAIVFNSPNNPTGKVFSREELQTIADLCLEHDLLADHRRDLRAHRLRRARSHAHRHAARHGRADGHDLRHLEVVLGHRLAGRLRGGAPGAGDRHPAGSRLHHGGGAASAPGGRGDGLRAARVLLRRAARVVPGAPRPSLGLPREGRVRRVEAARRVLHPDRRGPLPEAREHPDDTAFAMWLIERVGVATVPGSSFYAHPELGRTKIRFCFPKTDDMLRDAGERLLKLRP